DLGGFYAGAGDEEVQITLDVK
ncbi:MAG: hypothetical protein EZS28_039254, partial [Streblomastix strix]